MPDMSHWFDQLDDLPATEKKRMQAWIEQQLIREDSIEQHTNAAELAASIDPTFVCTPANLLMADEIERTMRTRRGRLLITVPPQEGKTTLTAVWGVIRALQLQPEWRVILASFSAALAEESSRAARNILAAHGTGAVDPVTREESVDVLGIGLANDRAQAANWRIQGHKGGMVAVGLGGTITGRPADCVSGDSYILTEHGYITAQQAYERNVQWILGYDHNAQSAAWRKVEASRRIDSRPVVEVITESGRVLTCTPDHRIYTGRGYTPAGNLRPHDTLVSIPSSTSVQMREDVDTARNGDTQGDSTRAESVLLEGVHERQSVGTEQDSLLPLRYADTPVTEINVLGQVLSGKPGDTSRNEGLPAVRGIVPAEVETNLLLLADLREQGSFHSDDWPWELTPQGWAELRKMVQSHEADHSGAGRSCVRGMQQHTSSDGVHPERETNYPVTISDSPYRRGREEQFGREPNYAFHNLPCNPPQVEGDAVAEVRTDGNGTEPVYDFQVEGTRNFFADGLLVHNCLIIDDPLKGMEAADSETERRKVIEGFQGDLTTRLAPGAPVILIQCMTGDTPVLRPDGSETPLRDVRPGDRVATWDEGRLSDATVTNWANQGPDEILIIATQSGRQVRANARHPFLVQREGYTEWVKAGQITSGDRLVALSEAPGKPGRGRGPTIWTTDEVVSVTAGGTEDVFDIEVEHTENFIANGLVSHNTRWHEIDLAGWILANEDKLPPERRRWKHINLPALAEDGLLDSLGREPGEWLESARGRRAQDWEETRDQVGPRVWSALYQGTPTPASGGLFHQEWFDQHRIETLPETTVRIVSIDPAETGRRDEAGIIAAAATVDGKVVWTEDWSGRMTSDQWARRAVLLALKTDAQEIAFEAYTTEQTYKRVIRQAWADIRDQARLLRDCRGDREEAALLLAAQEEAPPDPIAALAELDGIIIPDLTDPPFLIRGYRGKGDKVARATGARQASSTGRLRIVGALPALERQAVTWQQGQKSPDRMDAAVNAYERVVALIGGRSVVLNPVDRTRDPGRPRGTLAARRRA